MVTHLAYNRKDRGPKAISPTPLRDLIAKQSRARCAGLVFLMAALIACGGQAGVNPAIAAVPITHQLFFVLISGALLGSRLGCLSALTYLLMASVSELIWPIGVGRDAMMGPQAGYLWSLPLVAYVSGLCVDRERMESWAHFAVGIAAAIAIFNLFGLVRLSAMVNLSFADQLSSAATLPIGPYFAHGALAVFIAWTASDQISKRAN